MSILNTILVLDDVLTDEDHKLYEEYTEGLPLGPTPVFKISTGEHIVDENVRCSESVTVDNQGLLRLVDRTILEAMRDQGLSMKLARDHVTFIKYSEGGFFDWHRDHEQYIINQRRRWLECHLIYVISGPEKGGELQVRHDNDTEETIDMVKNRCIVFDKFLEHQGSKVLSGTKVIMTVDVLVSTPYIVHNDLDLALAEFLNPEPQSVLSYNLDVLQNYGMFPKGTIVFMVLKHNEDTVIFDSLGLYYRELEGDTTEIRTEDNEDAMEYSDTVRALLCLDICEVVQSEVADVDLTRYEPIPNGTDPKMLLSLPVIYPGIKREYAATYHCNEPNYDSFSLDQMIGFLVPGGVPPP